MEKAIKSYKDISKLYLGDCLEVIPTLKTDSIDAIVTDPPYGISFMGNDWDKAVPSIAIWRECLRVLKPGAFAFIMCIPRQDCLARMMCRLEDAGFNIGFSSIYWTYATGFPKAQNLSKAAEKRNMEPQLSRKLKGAYSGFQPKPAVEVIIVAMKPLSENTYIDQALKNGHGCTWLDECKIPYESEDWNSAKKKRNSWQNANYTTGFIPSNNPHGTITQKDRFPANVLCEDDVLNDENIRTTGGKIKNGVINSSVFNPVGNLRTTTGHVPGDSGSFSRYFSLDAWFTERIKLLPKEAQKTFPFMLVPKASKTEKYLNLDAVPEPSKRPSGIAYNEHSSIHSEKKGIFHPTMKPLKLMMWLIILGTQEGEIVLDPFMGSGTTPLAAKMTHRYCKGIELGKEFFDAAVKRLDDAQKSLNSFL